MARGYNVRDIKQKLLRTLSHTKTGMSGSKLSDELGVSRITLTKYLNVFAAEGLIRQQNIGNTRLWSLADGTSDYANETEMALTQFEFPNDYFKVKSKFLDYLIEKKENKVYNLIRNCIHSNVTISKLVSEVIYDSIISIQKLYDDAKIGNSELAMINNMISNSIKITELFIPYDPEKKKNVILISADQSSILFSQCAATSYRSENWTVYDLGNVSESIDVMFDLDMQKFLNKIWKQKSGIMIIVIFSQTEEDLKFFADTINLLRTKLGKKLFLILFNMNKKTKINADLIIDDIDKIIQWSQTVSKRHL